MVAKMPSPNTTPRSNRSRRRNHRLPLRSRRSALAVHNGPSAPSLFPCRVVFAAALAIGNLTTSGEDLIDALFGGGGTPTLPKEYSSLLAAVGIIAVCDRRTRSAGRHDRLTGHGPAEPTSCFQYDAFRCHLLQAMPVAQVRNSAKLSSGRRGAQAMAEVIQLTIEMANASDVDAIRALDRRVTGIDDRSQRLAKAIQARQCHKAELQNVLVGIAVMDQSFFEQSLISLVVVDSLYRRRGVASALIRHLEAVCPTPKLFTSTNSSNIAMQHVCEALGFTKSGYIDNLDEDGPEIIYFKSLKLAP